MVCSYCLVFLVRIFRSSARQNLGWITVCCGVIGITLVLLYLVPMLAGLIGAILSVIFIFIPSLGFSKVNRLAYQQQYGKASRLASWLCWLHPTDGWLEKSQLLLALKAAQKGNLTKATQLLQRYSTSSYHSQALLYSIKADWKNCLVWFNQCVPKQILLKDPVLITFYLRSLGETGDLNGLLQGIEMFESFLQKQGNIFDKNLLRMYAFAFCGQTGQVRQLFKGVLAVYPQKIQTFWILTSQMIAGKKDLTRQQLLNLRLCQDLILSNAIEWRLCNPPVDPNIELTQSSRNILFRLKTENNKKSPDRKITNLKSKRAYLTLILIGINLIVFGIEVDQGGSENLNNLYDLGGLVPQVVWDGEWWRVVTANFLHYGWLHLSMNMIGLYFLGRFVELSLGKFRYLVAYFVSGVGAMTIFSLVSIKLGNTDQILVGASAAIMGLIGVICAMFLQKWWKEKSRVSAHRLQMLLLVIGLQFIFDWNIPEVSILSHFLGLIVGLTIGLIYAIFDFLKEFIYK